jgi:riboflavin transporter FmnP
MNKSTKRLVILGMLTAVSIALYAFGEIPFAFMFPAYGFLKLDFHLLPGAIGAVFLGPVAGIIIIALSNFLHIVFGLSTTLGVGETVNMVAGIAFIIPLTSLLKKDNVLRIWHVIVTLVITLVVINFYNYYVAFPIYSKLFEAPVFNTTEFKTTFMLTAGIWFNLLKWGGFSIILLLMHSKLKKGIEKHI